MLLLPFFLKTTNFKTLHKVNWNILFDTLRVATWNMSIIKTREDAMAKVSRDFALFTQWIEERNTQVRISQSNDNNCLQHCVISSSNSTAQSWPKLV